MLSQRHIVFHDRMTPAGLSLRRVVSRPDRATPPGAAAPRRHVEPVSPAAADFCVRVLTEAGLDASPYRIEPLGRRVPACLRALGCDSVEEALAALQRDRHLLDRVVDTLLIGVTWFYRDTALFGLLRERVAREAVGRGRPWRIWSVGCSDGAELYTMAMALAEIGVLAGSELLGTDCRRSAIQRAQAGTYGDDRLLHLPPGWSDQYLQPVRGGRTVIASLREATQWEVADITACEGRRGQWDMILCRNLAIYLTPPAAHGLWERLVARLAVGGLLVLGKAERPQGSLPLKRLGLGLYLKLGPNEEKA